MYQYILFDLDGTLTDPKEGITKCIQYALREECGIEVTDADKLEHFIGPSLRDSFRDSYGIADADMDRVIARFQERYRPTGVKENQIYPGMHDMLHRLKKQGKLLAIASSKPQEFVHVVLQNFDIEDCFAVIVGSVQDNVNDSKIEVMGKALAQLQKRAGKRFDRKKVLMVGDRRFDVEGARHFEVDSAAVTYGYAPEGELEQCRPTYMADSVEALEEIITGQPAYYRYRNKASLLKTWEILYPLLAYWAVEMLVVQLLFYILNRKMYLPGVTQRQMRVYINAAATIAVWPLLAYLYRKSAPRDISFVVTRRKEKRIRREGILIAAYGAAMALGINILFAGLGMAGFSDRYQEVAASQYSVALPVGLVIYGILTPFTEELIFRGVIYNRTKKYFPVALAVFLNAIVFGCYHGNLVQIVYAFIMGLVMAFLYEHYGHLAAPVIFHASANLLVYLAAKSDFGQGGRRPVLYAAAMLALSAGITCWYIRGAARKKQG